MAGDAAADPIERLSFKVGALHALGKAGRIEEAISLGKELIDGLASMGQPALAARAALNVGNVLLERDRYSDAIGFLSAAIPALESGGYAIEAASAHLGLSTANLFGGSLSVAKAEAERVIRRARKLESYHLGRLARINLAHIALLRGRADEALDAFIELERELTDVPAEHARCQEFIGDSYVKLNLWDEAIDAYHQALSSPAVGGNGRANIELGIGQAYAGAGDRKQALEAFRKAFRIYRRIGNDAWASAALSAEAALSDSKTLSRKAVQVARESGSAYHLAVALLISDGSDDRKQAKSIIRRHGFASLEWRAAYLEARSSVGFDRIRAYRKMFKAIERGRASVNSLTSRTSYLKDKAEALREYLDELLQRPTAARVEEAVQVVVRSRSVALLDEVLASNQQIHGEASQRLIALREELQTLTDSEPAGGAQRRLVGSAENLASIQRRWNETARVLFDEEMTQAANARPDTLVLIEARDRIHAIVSGRSTPLDITPSELAKSLKWLQFDLYAPIVDKEAHPAAAMGSLKAIGEQILGPLRAQIPGIRGVCADGGLWQIPWDACLSAMGFDQSMEMRLHPGFQGGEEQAARRPERVALWVAASPDLPFAEREAEAFLSIYPHADVFTTAEQVRSSCRGSYDLVHVIGHARQREANPMFSFFAFSDEPLYATEVARLQCRTEIALLSACETGALSLSSVNEPDGLARAFLARGASSVIASGWPLDDEAASLFSCNFINYIYDGISVRCAINRSRQIVRAWNEHPYFWGCPVLYGGYRS